MTTSERRRAICRAASAAAGVSGRPGRTRPGRRTLPGGRAETLTPCRECRGRAAATLATLGHRTVDAAAALYYEADRVF